MIVLRKNNTHKKKKKNPNILKQIVYSLFKLGYNYVFIIHINHFLLVFYLSWAS